MVSKRRAPRPGGRARRGKHGRGARRRPWTTPARPGRPGRGGPAVADDEPGPAGRADAVVADPEEGDRTAGGGLDHRALVSIVEQCRDVQAGRDPGEIEPRCPLGEEPDEIVTAPAIGDALCA